ncbi:MAG: AAA family ATPase [Candidatus Nomurabacteria bacterium]|nr:AAA family ATPase [Candidatus Nomurabacteria bacterium]
MSFPSLLGLSGTFASGKDTLANYLAENFNFHHVSTGDIVRQIALQKYGNKERPTLRQTADELRHQNGSGALVVEALKTPRPLVISGLRSLGEAKAVKAAGGILVFVGADDRVRYERMRSRHRDDETYLTFEQFLENEKSERRGDPADDAAFNIDLIAQMADLRLDNSGDLDEFLRGAVEKLTKFNQK